MIMAKAVEQGNKCTHAQQQFLLKELASCSRYQIRKTKQPPVPAVVIAARKKIAAAKTVVDAYEKKRVEATTRQEVAYDELVRQARDRIYFGSADEARAAVQALQRWMKDPR
jgi:phage terminase large subunit-like protein